MVPVAKYATILNTPGHTYTHTIFARLIRIDRYTGKKNKQTKKKQER